MRTVGLTIVLLAIGVVANATSDNVVLSNLMKHHQHSNNHPSNDPGDDSYEFLILVQQWAPTVCMTTSSCTYSQGTPLFTIHGLWPSRADGSYPQFCTQQQFDESAVSALLTDMQTYWPSLENSGDDGFWSHEYEKHATCAEDILPSEYSFFNEALSLRKQVDGIESINASNQGMSIEDMRSQIQQAAGASQPPILFCHFSDHTQYVLQIGFCYDKSLNMIACPCGDSGCNADDQIALPPMQ